MEASNVPNAMALLQTAEPVVQGEVLVFALNTLEGLGFDPLEIVGAGIDSFGETYDLMFN